MNKAISTFLLLISFHGMASAQIDMSDTTVYVIAHWKMGEKQKYHITRKKTITEENNIISTESILYSATAQIIDSTEVGYILEWVPKEFGITTNSALDTSLLKITDNIPFWILTDEYGSSVQLLNWEDVGKAIRNRIEVLKEQFQASEDALKQLRKIERITSSKELMELNYIRDVQQLLAFHGAKYAFGKQIDFTVKVPNNYGGDPLDANAAILLEQINLEQGSIILRSSQRINPTQLTAVTYDYLKSVNMIGGNLPTLELFPTITKLIWGGSEIHANSGWVIYSEETTQTNQDKLVTVEEQILELVRN